MKILFSLAQNHSVINEVHITSHMILIFVAGRAAKTRSLNVFMSWIFNFHEASHIFTNLKFLALASKTIVPLEFDELHKLWDMKSIILSCFGRIVTEAVWLLKTKISLYIIRDVDKLFALFSVRYSIHIAKQSNRSKVHYYLWCY